MRPTFPGLSSLFHGVGPGWGEEALRGQKEVAFTWPPAVSGARACHACRSFTSQKSRLVSLGAPICIRTCSAYALRFQPTCHRPHPGTAGHTAVGLSSWLQLSAPIASIELPPWTLLLPETCLFSKCIDILMAWEAEGALGPPSRAGDG